MAQVFTVTASTSVVLISTLTAPNTIVLLSSVRNAGQLVGIRDTTGNPLLAHFPVIVSTMSGLRFYDGTSSFLFQQPNGFVSLASKDTSTWQLLNSKGFLTTLSNSFLQTLTTQSGYVQTLQSASESISSLTASRVEVLSSIQVLGTTNIQGNVTITGSFDVFSTLRAYQNVSLSSGLVVGGNVSFPSSLSVKDTLQVGSNLSTLQDLVVGDQLVVDKSMVVQGALLPPFISVQTLHVSSLQVGGGLQTAGGISTTNLSVAKDGVVAGTGLFQTSLSNLGLVSIYDNLTLAGALNTQTLSVEQKGSVASVVQANNVTASGAISTLQSVSVSGRLVASNGGLVEGELRVLNTTELQNLNVLGSADISSLSIYTSLQSEGDASSWSSTFRNTAELNVRGPLVLGSEFQAPQAFVSIQDTLSTLTRLSIYETLSVKGTLNVRMNSYLGGDVNTLSTLFVQDNVSTTSLSAVGNVYVDGSLYVSQVASASTLGAPIGLQISTLTLSNALSIDTYGYVPQLQVFSYPERMAAGASPSLVPFDLAVDGVLQNRNSVTQTSGNTPSKQWYATTMRLSTLSGLSNLSAAVIGPTTFEYPLTTAQGLIIVGSNAEITPSNIYYGFSPSTLFQSVRGSFGSLGTKVAYGSNFWVAVGAGASATNAIQYSADGYNWNTIASGGFPLRGLGIAYGSGRWVAVGVVGPGPYTQAAIQTSVNGVTWTNGTGNVFNAISGFGGGVAYNGSNLWVAVGSDPGVGGIKYSGTGTAWSNATLFPNNVGLSFVAVGFGNGLWLASDGATTTYSSSNGTQWFLVGSAVPRLAYSYVSINGSGFWLGGGSNVGGNPLTTIQISPNGSNWVPITTGGFQTACRDITQNPGYSTFVAVGEDAAPVTTILQYSSNLQNWVTGQVFRGTGYGIGVGQLTAPSGRPLFTANVTSIFHSNVSVATLYASSIKASSVFGFYTADGSNLTRVGTYTSSIRVSSLNATTLNTHEISTNRFFGTLVTASDSIEVPRTTFFSTGNLFVAAGSDSLLTGNLQTSVNGSQWTRSLNSNFQFYGNAIAGNSNIADPLFVAVGADSRTAYTIQYSANGRVWSPANTGGFSYATDLGIREGTGIAYSSNLNLWVAVGRSVGSTNTILYSADGSNWSEASGGFQDYGTQVKVQGSNFVAFGNGVRWSSNGTQWYPSGVQPALTAIGYGTFISGPISLDAWIGIATSNIYTSVNNGQSWSLGQTTVAPVSDVVYKNNLWIAVGSNVIQTSLTGFAWSAVTTSFSSNVSFHSVSYSSNLGVWIAAAESPTNTQTLWTSLTGTSWSPITSGGFSTSVDAYGVGYGVFSLAASTLAVGVSALDINLNLLPAILNLSTNAGVAGSTITTLSLTASNASNVFSTSVRGLWGTTDEIYKFIAVGDGLTPQKTIARSIDATPGSWLPAITGGFSTTGYNVTYAKNKWFAVGDAANSTNVIQYSPDGANWFGANTATALRQGGRGIAVGIGALSQTLVAVGKDPTTSTIVYSGNGSNWSNATSGYFNVQGNAVAAGSNAGAANFVATGQDTRGTTNTILTSADGISWANVASGGFSVAGYGAAWNKDLARWVAVGEDADSNKTIQYSVDGALNFIAATNSFTSAGYGVTYNSSIGIFFAVGKDVDGNSPQTIKYSADGATWENFSTGSGFISQKSLGTANGVFVQPILTKETTPYMEFSNLIVYERTEPFLYFKPTIRLQSTFVSFNETLFVTISSQVIIGSNVPIGLADFSVYGTTYTSSLQYRGIVPIPSTLFVSSMIVSTFSSIGTIEAKSLFTPSLTINATTESKANTIVTSGNATSDYLTLNNALFIPAGGGAEMEAVGIRNQTPFYDLDVQGSMAASTLSSFFLYAPQNIYVSAPRVYFQDDSFSMLEGFATSQGHTLQTTRSTLTLNSVLTLQVSTQRVGVYTRNPQVELDVQRQGYLGSLQANTINTSLLFLTLQSI